MRRLAVHLSLGTVVFFGLCGAFISNAVGVSKIHYAPLAIALALVALSVALHKPFLWLLLLASALAAASPLVAPEQNALLSYFAVVVLPLVWFCVGKYIDPQRVGRFFLLLAVVLMFGLALEISDIAAGLFPIIPVEIGGELGRRYGSFGVNPLALGYFASTAGILAFNMRRRWPSAVLFALSLVLVFAANSRGAIVCLFVSIAFFAWIAGGKAPLLHVILRVLLYGLIVSAVLMASQRAASVFDWKAEEGNLGRLSQWAFCSAVALENPTGIGPGAMSPIGVGDDPYIEEGIVKSCDSMPLKIAVEYGIATAVGYVLLITTLLIRLTKRARQSADVNLATCAALCWGTWLVQLMNQSIESIWIGAVFFAFLGHLYWNTRHSLAIDRKLSTASAVVS